MEERNITPVNETVTVSHSIERLPEAFINRIREQLGGEYESFAASFLTPPLRGLRANRLKTTPDSLCALLPFPLSSVRWCADGFTYPSDARPAKHWTYHAGLFYIQEPSAMCPVTVLDARPGERVLDICAAPGGKSAQLAGQLQGKGLLVANDASASRCRALVRNLELAGVTNAVVLNEQPRRLAERFSGFFDCVLVDAPCSGEGMFRRDPEAARAWAANKPEACAHMQREILRYAAEMLRPGGRMVYSTCTFGPDENERIIEAFLVKNPAFTLLPINHARLGVSNGLLPEAARIWPHRANGEGHFVALLQKKIDGIQENTLHKNDTHAYTAQYGASIGASARNVPKKRGSNKKNGDIPKREDTRIFEIFRNEYLRDLTMDGRLSQHEQSLFVIPDMMPALDGLRIARGGWYVGDIRSGRFIPSQALAMGLTRQDARVIIELTANETLRYLSGDSFEPSCGTNMDAGDKSWVLVCTHGYPLGWARFADGRLKNHRPNGWAVSGIDTAASMV